MKNPDIDLKKIIGVVVVILVVILYTIFQRPVSLIADPDTAQLDSLTVVKNGQAEDVTDQGSAEDVLWVLETGDRAKNGSAREENTPEEGEYTATVTDSTGTYVIILKPETEDASVLYYEGQDGCYAVKQSAYLISLLEPVLAGD